MFQTQLTDDVYWLGQCDAENGAHLHLSQYVIDGDESTYLVDAGAGLESALVERVETIADGSVVDVLLLTHAVLPHTANVSRVRERWPGVEIIATTPIVATQGLPEDSDYKLTNHEETIGDRTFTFIDPLITDVVLSNWIYDHPSKTLFTAEGVGHYHQDGACEATSSTLPDGIEFENVRRFHEDKLPFLEVVDPDKLRRAFHALFESYDVETVAPMHGNPIDREHIPEYVDTVCASNKTLYAGGDR